MPFFVILLFLISRVSVILRGLPSCCRFPNYFQSENIQIRDILDSAYTGRHNSKSLKNPPKVMSCYQNADMDLLFFSSIDEATKTWLDALHRMWALCKYLIQFLPYTSSSRSGIKYAFVSITGKKCDGVSKTLTDYFETAPNPYLSTLRILVNISDFDHMTNSKSLAFAGLPFNYLFIIMAFAIYN